MVVLWFNGMKTSTFFWVFTVPIGLLRDMDLFFYLCILSVSSSLVLCRWYAYRKVLLFLSLSAESFDCSSSPT